MRVGIIGGGQLAMMLCEAANERNIETIVLDPNSKCSAKNTCTTLIVGAYDDLQSLELLAKSSDVVTYEFENVDVQAIDIINEKYKNIVQTSKPLKLANDRALEKMAAIEAGFDPVPFRVVESCSQINEFAAEVGFPLVLKTRRYGYDGKGQRVIKNDSDVKSQEVIDILNEGAIIEQMVDVQAECSVIAFRNNNYDFQTLPIPTNYHVSNILFTSYIEKDNKNQKIIDLVKKYVEYHNLIGIITVEVFITKNDKILFNEIAPRPHNSGHYSIEGCNVSQYDLHLQAILNEKLQPSYVIDNTKMINVLGQDYEFAQKWYNDNNNPNIYFHDYCKCEVKQDRKMAHITAVGKEQIEKLNEYELVIKERNE